MGYTIHTIKGISWMGGIRIVIRVLTFVKTAIIARILSPAQFGIFGIATLALAFIEILTETGINIFLVQQKEETDKYINTSWLVSICRGTVIAIVIFMLAPFLSKFFHSSESYKLLILISSVPFVRGFINPSVVKFQKELLFHKEFYYRSFLFFIESFFSVLLVVYTGSVESLIWGLIIGALFEVFLSFVIIRPIPKFQFDINLLKHVLSEGKWITFSGIFNYFYQHGDDMAVGRILGTTSLGFYDMAYRISLVPLSDIADAVAKVVFPVYVKISDDPKRLRIAFYKSFFVVVALVLPIGIILFLFSQEIISVLLGSQWLQASKVLKILALFGVVRAISIFSTTIFLSIQRQDIVTLVSFIGLAGLGVTIVPFIIQWGIEGAGLSALLGTTLTIPVIGYYLYFYIYKRN